MRTKLSVALVTLSMIATVFIGIAAADGPPFTPAGGTSWIGPRPQDDCAVAQALGAGGNGAGSGGSPAGTNGYHSYINEASGIILDSCFNLQGVPGFANCFSSNLLADIAAGVALIVAGVLGLDTSLILAGINVIVSGLLGLYQNQCGGLGGTGTDGEFEYGDKAAALNVRVGTTVQGGDGVKSCIGALATAHHGADTTVYVTDAVSGGAIGYTLAADWARGALYSNDGTDRNTAPDISHCGDGALEPCAIGNNGWRNDLLVDNSAPELPQFIPPGDSGQLARDLDTAQGCNPLDRTNHQDPSGGHYNAYNPGTGSLAAYGLGGASGFLTVLIDENPGVTVGYDLAQTPPVTQDQTTLSAPSVGWVWTGTGASSPTNGCRLTIGTPLPYTCTYVEHDANCPSGHRVWSYWSLNPNPHQPSPPDIVISNGCSPN